jgi:hypothetical protein
MNPEWLCYVNGQEYGPYTWPQLVQMAASGNVVPQTYVRRNFDSQWYLAEQVPGLFSPAVPAGPKQAARPATPPRTAAAGISPKKPNKSGAHSAVSAKTTPTPAATALLPEPTPEPVMQQPVVKQPVMEQPVVQPAVPKGRAVAPKSAAVAPAAENKPQWIPVNPTAATSSASSSLPLAVQSADSEGKTPATKPDKSKNLVLMLGGAICAVAILGGIAVVWKVTRKPEEPNPIAAAPVEIPATESDPNIVAEEANPAGEVNPVETPATKPATKPSSTPGKPETAGTKKGTAAPAANAATNALLRSISAWRPIEKFSRIKIDPGLHCIKLQAYLAADEQGRKVAVRAEGIPPAAPGEAAPEGGVNAAVAPATEGAPSEAPVIIAPMPTAPAGPVKYVSAEAAPFLFVEVTITNPDSKPRPYTGWNNADTAALLIDATGKPFTLLPPSATPNVKRQASQELQPGATIQDTLVFAVPPTGDLLFRLALPKPAFSPKLNGAWSYEISGVALVGPPAGTAPATAGPGEAPLVPRSSTTIPIPGLQDVPPPQPAPQPAPEKPADMPEPEKKPMPTERIPIPGLTDVLEEKKPAGPKRAEEVPNLAPPPPKK